MDTQVYYRLIPSRFGNAGFVWRRSDGGPRVCRVFLPGEKAAIKGVIRESFPGVEPGSDRMTAAFGGKIERYLAGRTVALALDILDMDRCSAFQKQVLTWTYRIPRGKVVTYSWLAAMLKMPGAARAVGTALARNPFALVIPCHRVVRSGGEIGGFGGGAALKKALLEMEGVKFDAAGRVSARNLIR